MTRTNTVFSAGTRPRGARQSKRSAKRILLALGVVSLLAVSSTALAIDIDIIPGDPPVGTNGPFTFDDQPTTADWVQIILTGDAGAIADLAGMTTRVQQLNATTASALGVDTAASPVRNNGPARWNSALFALETGPTGIGGQTLIGKFNNVSDNFITDFLLTYDVGRFPPPPGNAETIDGHAVFYSLSGAPNSWVPFDDDLDPSTPANNVYGGFGGSTFLVANGLNWGNETLYVLWADDNGPPSDDTFTIDNLIFEAVPGGPKEPPPPPTPVFGDILPDAINTVGTENFGNLTIASQFGGTILDEGGNNILYLTGTSSMALTTDQVDLRSWDPLTHEAIVSVDLRSLDTSEGSDFESGEESISVIAQWSADGLTFQDLEIYNENGGAAPWPSPDDEIKLLDTGPNGAFTRVFASLPPQADTVRVLVNGTVAGSTTEHLYFDNISVSLVPIPEPGSIVLFGLGVVGLLGIRRRRAA